MVKPSLEELLKNKRVIDEINRHLWIESEKAGHDIGFDYAAKDWYSKHASQWVKYHMSHKCQKTKPRKLSKK